MFCNNCGNQTSDGATFCQNCGAPMQPTQPTPIAEEKTKKKVKPLAIILPIIAVILVVAIVLAIVFLPDKSEKNSDTDTKSGTKTEQKVDDTAPTLSADDFYMSKEEFVWYRADGYIMEKSSYEYFLGDKAYFSLVNESDGVVTESRDIERDDQGRITKYTITYTGGQTVYEFGEYKEEDGIFVSSADPQYNEDEHSIKLGYKDGELVLREETYKGTPMVFWEKKGNVQVERIHFDGLSEYDEFTYYYNENNQLIRSELKTAGSMSEDYVFTYKYDQNGNEIENIHYDYTGEVVKKTTLTYDENGNNTGYIEYDKNDVVTYQHTAKYNEYNICIESKTVNSEGRTTSSSKLVESTNEKIVVDNYNSYGETSSRYVYQIENGKIVTLNVYYGNSENLEVTYKYNEYGLLVERLDYHQDGYLSVKTTCEYTKK